MSYDVSYLFTVSTLTANFCRCFYPNRQMQKYVSLADCISYSCSTSVFVDVSACVHTWLHVLHVHVVDSVLSSFKAHSESL